MGFVLNCLKFTILIAVISIANTGIGIADDDLRHQIIELVKSTGFSGQLYAGVEIASDSNGVISIVDKGRFFMQYVIADSNNSIDPNIIVDPNIRISETVIKLVLVTHGWIDKGAEDWPADTARAFYKKVDPNEWLCCYFDWKGGAGVVNPVDAAKYARDIASARLAMAVLKLNHKFEHIHLVGHSAGSWTINGAASILKKQIGAAVHLTFLDAYVPPFWKQPELGKDTDPNTDYAEHYYTKDITHVVTQKDLTNAHNVDITDIDMLVKDHEFPYRWYYATVADRYDHRIWEKDDPVITKADDIHYGYVRGLEAGKENWDKSVELPRGNRAVKLLKPK